MARLRRFRRPSNQEEEIRVLYATEHRCPQAAEKYQREGREAAAGCDAVLFPIGAFGSGHPNGSVFEVQSTEPCGACGTLLKIWAVWDGATIIDLGAK